MSLRALASLFVRFGRTPPRAALAILVVVGWFATDLASATFAEPSPKGLATIAQSLSDDGAPSDGPRLVGPTLSYDQLVVRIDVTSKELRVATRELEQADLALRGHTEATEELRGEAEDVASETLRAAIDGYRHSELSRGLLGVEDVTARMRANALGGAAVSSDVESFDAYRTLRKDLELTEAELIEREGLVTDGAAEVATLESQLTGELIRFGELTERRIQDQAVTTAAQASNRAQARGRKQGFYLDTCPVNGPHSFIDSWGFARSGGRRHKGVDMLAPRGTEVVAPVSGRVEHFSNSVGGRSYRLFGDDGNYFYGTHLDGFGQQGQVAAGAVIGYVGDDGNAAGINHLHFEIHPGGRGNPINPYIDTAAVCNGDE